MHLYRDIYRRAVEGKCNRPIRCSCSLKNRAYAYVFTKRLNASHPTTDLAPITGPKSIFPIFLRLGGEKKINKKKRKKIGNLSKIGKKRGEEKRVEIGPFSKGEEREGGEKKYQSERNI